jgi:CBS domain-containing protein
MCTVAELLDQKANRVETIGADATVYDAIKRMADLDIGALVVTHGGRVVGTITERDYSRNVFLKGKSSPMTSVRDAMNKTLLAVDPGETTRRCMAIMTCERTRHLVIMESGELLGIVSIGDLVHSIVAEQLLTIEELEQYILQAP